MTDQDPRFTPEQAEEATDPQRQEGPPIGASIPPPLLGTRIRAAAGPAAVDVDEIIARLNDQVQNLMADMARLKQGQAPAGAHPLEATAKAIRDMLATHFDGTGAAAGPDVLRLADDVTDAARNAVESGDTGTVRQLGQRLERALNRAHPGPGDHHWFRQALDFTRNHLQEAADTVDENPPAPSGAPAIGSGGRPPAKVIEGSVTGEVR